MANLVAQVGADLTQFKLGMNEVDARLNQVRVRGQQMTTTVAAMRAQAARLDSVASNASYMQAALGARRGAAANTAFNAQQQADTAKQIKDLQAARVATLQAMPVGKRTGIVQARKDLAAAIEDMKKMQAEAVRASEALQVLDAREAKYAATARAAAAKSAYIGTRANMYEESVDTSNDVATAMTLRRQQDAAEHRTRALNAIAGTAVVGGAIIEGGLAIGTKAGADFNLMLTNMAHNTMLTTKNIQFMNAVVEQLGVEGGGNMEELAHGFRLFTDYTFSAAEAARGLRTAMKGSIATGTDIGDTAELLAKATKEFNLPRTQSGLDKTMSEMIETGRRSTLTMQQMIDVGGQLYATAANLGVSFTEANAALITFTQHGLSGSQAATQLRNDIQKITQPTAAVRKELEMLHKLTGVDLPADFTNVGLRARGLRGEFDEVVKTFDKLSEAQRKKLNVQTPSDLAEKIFPNLRGTTGALIATGTGFQDFQNNYQHLVDSLSHGSQVNSMYQESLANLDNQLGRVENMGTILASTIANALTPSIVKLIGGANSLFENLNGVSERTKETDIQFIALAGAALILFGTVGKLVIGVAQLRTALITMGVAQTALAPVALLARFGPWVIILTAAAIAVYELSKSYNQLSNTGDVLNAKLDQQISSQQETAKAHFDTAIQVNVLVSRYEQLIDVTKRTHDQNVELQSIYQQLMQLAPNLIKGYNDEGIAIGLIGDAADRSAASLRDMTDALITANQQSNNKAKMDLADTYDQRATDTARLRYSLKTNMFPDSDGAGGWNFRQAKSSADMANPYTSQDENPWHNPITNSGFGHSATEGSMKTPTLHQGSPEERAAAAAQLDEMIGKERAIAAISKQIDTTVRQEVGHRKDVNTAFNELKNAQDQYNKALKNNTGMDMWTGKHLDVAGAKAQLDKANAAFASNTGAMVTGGSDGGPLPWAKPQTTNIANDGISSDKSGVNVYKDALKAAQQQLFDLHKAYFDISHDGSAAEIMWDMQAGKLAELAKYSRAQADALYAQSLAQATLNDETKKYMDAKKEADAADFDMQKQKVIDTTSVHKNLAEAMLELTSPGGKYAHLYHQAGSPKLPNIQDIINNPHDVSIGSTMTPDVKVPKGGVAPMPVSGSSMDTLKKQFFSLVQQILSGANAKDQYNGPQTKSLVDFINAPLKKIGTPQDEFASQLAQDPESLNKYTGVKGKNAMSMLSGMGDLGETNDQLKAFVATGEDVAHILGDIYAAHVAAAKAASDDAAQQKKVTDELSKYKGYLTGKLQDSANQLAVDKGGASEAQGKHDEFIDSFKKQYSDVFDDPSQGKNQAAMLAAAESTYKQIAANDALDKTSKDVADIMKKVKDANDAMSESYLHSVGDIKISAAAWKAMSKTQQDTIKHLKETSDIKSILTDAMSQTADIFGKSLNNLREHGFKGFFDGVVQDFENMLFQLAVKWLESQFLQLMQNQLPSILGALGGAISGGGGGTTATGGGSGASGFTSGPGSVTAATGSPMEKGRSYIVGENKAERLTVDEQGNMHIDNMGAGMRGPGRASPTAVGASNSGDTHIHQYFNINGVQNPSQFKNTEGQIGYQSAINARRALNRDR